MYFVHLRIASIASLNSGKLRLATRDGVGQWTRPTSGLKKAVLLSLGLNDNAVVRARATWAAYDEVPTKFGGIWTMTPTACHRRARGAPGAVARRGSYFGPAARS